MKFQCFTGHPIKIMDTKKTMDRILEARENRAAIRQNMINEGVASISLSLNIPGIPKTNPEIETFFNLLKDELFIYFKSNRIEIREQKQITLVDEAGNFCLIPVVENISIQEIKNRCEAFEEKHVLGRLIDIDVVGSDGKYISSNKMKKCMLCNEYAALECMHEQRHSYEDIRTFIRNKIRKYIDQQKEEEICRSLSSFALRSILYEISLTPKPGLVDTVDSGIHKDMDYHSFLDSSAEISTYFHDLARAGYHFQADYDEALPLIRSIGLRMEERMFNITNKVNTQKGIIFLMGVSLFSSANLISKKASFTTEEFNKLTKTICKNILIELQQNNQDLTHGIKCANNYGIEIGGGARYEVYTGFSTVLKYGLLQLQDFNLSQVSNKKKALTAALLSLMAHNNDTNVLFRSDLNTLKELQHKAHEALLNFSKNDFEKYYKTLNDFCIINKVSPGGAADLLAVSIFIYFTNKQFSNAI